MWRGAEDINYGITYILTLEVRNTGVELIKRSAARYLVATRSQDFCVDHAWTYGLKENISLKTGTQKFKLSEIISSKFVVYMWWANAFDIQGLVDLGSGRYWSHT